MSDDEPCTGCYGSGYDSMQEARCHCQPPEPARPPREIWIWFTDGGHIRKWSHSEFPEGIRWVPTYEPKYLEDEPDV